MHMYIFISLYQWTTRQDIEDKTCTIVDIELILTGGDTFNFAQNVKYLCFILSSYLVIFCVHQLLNC